LLNSALFAPELRVELLANPVGAAMRLASVGPERDTLDGAWPPPPSTSSDRIDLTPDDWALLHQLPPSHSLADLWRSIDAAAAQAGGAPPAEWHAALPTLTTESDALEVAAGRRTA
jgi:hypothetical protein